MTTQTEALKLALDEIKRVKEICLREVGIGLCNEVVIAKLEEALAQEKALQALHDENERLGLYKDAYAKPEEEKLHPVHIGVDVTREGTAVTAFYRKPDAVMEMFYSQFHPLAQPEQEPVALETVYETIIQWDEGGGKRSRRELARRIVSLYTKEQL